MREEKGRESNNEYVKIIIIIIKERDRWAIDKTIFFYKNGEDVGGGLNREQRGGKNAPIRRQSW